MADFLRLLFLVPLGYLAAVVAAALTILAGWYGHDAGAIASDVVATGAVIGVGFWVVAEVGALAAVPALIAIVLAELFRWRSVFFYLAVGGGLGLLASPLGGADGSPVLLLAAGFVGGFAYWFVAGRLAGVAAAPEPPAGPAV
jgi:hypothetical protein